jgi:aldehyde dehydrogenase (NAD+)
MNVETLFQAQKKNSWPVRQTSSSERREWLQKLFDGINAREAQICAALKQDFGKSELETLTTEIGPVLQEIKYVRKHLKAWMRPEKVAATLLLAGSHNEIRSEAKGLVLIIAPWNYPFQLAILPLVTALAAGNCVILKPSELTPATSALMETLITELFPANLVTVVQGDKDVSQKLLALPFDHIFFTGSTAVGKIVMEAASKNLAGVTLELGGKSPTIVDDSADLDVAAEKILWGKFINAGQTCVAPDYLLVQTSVHKALMRKLKDKLDEFSTNLKEDHARIISSQHMQRLNGLFNTALADQALLVSGGQFDFAAGTISPTILEKIAPDSAIMKEEIFGPLLPVVNFNQISDAIQFVNQRPKPLAMYIFSHSSENIEKILTGTTAGGVTINDTLLHFINHHLPFGGVGDSGLGNYHGHFGYQTFTHQKAVLRQGWLGKLLRVVYPPYTPWKTKMARRLMRWG